VQVPGSQACGITSDQLTFGWITGNFAGQSLKLAGLPNGTYRLEWWDCVTGTVLSTNQTTVTDGLLSSAIPPTSQEDLAFKIFPWK